MVSETSTYLDLSATTGFAGNALDRCAGRRDDAAFILSQRADPRARFVLFVQDMPLVWAGAPDDRSAQAAQAPVIGADSFTATQIRDALGEAPATAVGAAGATDSAGRLADVDVFLGCEADGTPWFGRALPLAANLRAAQGGVDAAALQARLDRHDESAAKTCETAGRLTAGNPIRSPSAVPLRALAAQGRISHAHLGMLAQAKAALDWHARHGFCARCGTATHASASGWRRDCSACRAQHFPRVDPVVIMLVVDRAHPDGPRCLLGRQPQFATGMYSALAGFLEPGETVEDAVRREVFEEAGVRCGEVRYMASQPWPFPSSLMLGCIADARDTALAIDNDELEDARWFDRAQIRAMSAGKHADGFSLPQRHAIAHTLIRSFIESDDADIASSSKDAG